MVTAVLGSTLLLALVIGGKLDSRWGIAAFVVGVVGTGVSLALLKMEKRRFSKASPREEEYD